MDILRTPDDRFQDLPGFDLAPHYVEVEGLRIHFLDEGPADAEPVVLLHGEPTWAYLYRKMIAPLTDAGFRVLVPDLVGFGRSDKPTDAGAYTYQSHMDWLAGFLGGAGISEFHLFCQDWGGLLGLRLAGEQPERIRSIAAANTFLPTGTTPLPEAFFRWRQFSQDVPEMPVGRIVTGGCVRDVAPAVEAAYDAPFPDERHKAGARAFPILVPDSEDAPGAGENRAAWSELVKFERPFLTCFSDGDPITAGADEVLRARIPGAAGQPHFIVQQAGHFLQEDAGEELVPRYARWLSGLGD